MTISVAGTPAAAQLIENRHGKLKMPFGRKSEVLKPKMPDSQTVEKAVKWDFWKFRQIRLAYERLSNIVPYMLDTRYSVGRRARSSHTTHTGVRP